MGSGKKKLLPVYSAVVDSAIAIYYAIWWTGPEWIYNLKKSGLALENGKYGDTINIDDYVYYRGRYNEIKNPYPYDKRKKFVDFLEKNHNSVKNPFF